MNIRPYYTIFEFFPAIGVKDARKIAMSPLKEEPEDKGWGFE